MSERPTQRDRVLRLLSDGRWHSTVEFVELGILRAAARVYELRRRGYVIEAERVPGCAPVYAYRLVSSGGAPAPDVSPLLGTALTAGAEEPDGQLEISSELDEPPRSGEVVDEPELPSLEERRRIAAEARAAFELALRRDAS